MLINVTNLVMVIYIALTTVRTGTTKQFKCEFQFRPKNQSYNFRKNEFKN